ncbi:hypothetical protein F4777DRAFT_550498 [Nemania sp. FL0916]|nr:hypothetical protein F4777DRAFT_550498 [Nemania sp. FL0916]
MVSIHQFLFPRFCGVVLSVYCRSSSTFYILRSTSYVLHPTFYILRSTSYIQTMAQFLTALLAVAALLQVGTAAPYYPLTNGTVSHQARHLNTTSLPIVPIVVPRREMRTYPIALRRP